MLSVIVPERCVGPLFQMKLVSVNQSSAIVCGTAIEGIFPFHFGVQDEDLPALATTRFKRQSLWPDCRLAGDCQDAEVEPRIDQAARLVGGGSWRRTVTLRDATAEPARLRAALGSKLLDLPAPVVALTVEVLILAESVGSQLELVQPEGAELRAHLSEGLRQVRAGTGSGSVCTVVEVAPWSRLPEQRALLVPRDD